MIDSGTPGEGLEVRLDWFRILKLHPDGVVILDPAGRCRFANHAALRILGVRREELQRRGLDHDGWKLRGVDGRPLGPGSAPHSVALRWHRPVLGAEVQVDRPDGRSVVLAINAAPLPAGEGGAIVSFRDITDRHRLHRRQRVLLEAGAALDGPLDLDETLARVARAAVPAFADFCTVELIEPSGDVRRVSSSASDPRFDDAASVVSAPLLVRGRRIGAIVFGLADSRRTYDADDQRLAEELARRAALAIENARLYERAETSSRAKSDFIGVMSHELRTPLTTILGYADLLGSGVTGPLSEPQRSQLERIKVSAWQLTRIVDEVLTFSRIEAGHEKVTHTRIDPADIVTRAAAMMEPNAAEHGLVLRTDIHTIGVRLGDAQKLRQIVLNLLSNAIKFTPEGAITVRLTADEGSLYCDVADTGIGIPEAFHNQVFEAFWQVEQGTTRAHGGTGLGLTVSRRLARLLGGDLTMESRPAEGSVFRLRIPAPRID